MNKEKRIWMVLFLALTLMLILSGCSGLPKTAKINISVIPNPVPYDTEDEDWPCDLYLSESNGVGITLISLRFDSYDQAEELIYTQLLYEEDILDWFDSNYLPAFSSLENSIHYYIAPVYAILTVAGVDDNDNPIEATGRIDFLPE